MEIPRRTGFGHIVIDRNMRAALEGDVRLDFRSEGFCWSLQIPASFVGAPDPRGAPAAPRGGPDLPPDPFLTRPAEPMEPPPGPPR